MTELSLGVCLPNLKFVSLVTLELLAFNVQKFKGSRDPGHDPFRKNYSGVMSGISLGAKMPNLKFVPLVILGNLTLVTPLFEKKFHKSCRDFPWEHACQI